MTGDVQVNDVFQSYVPGPPVVTVTVVNDVIGASQDDDPRIFNLS